MSVSSIPLQWVCQVKFKLFASDPFSKVNQLIFNNSPKFKMVQECERA